MTNFAGFVMVEWKENFEGSAKPKEISRFPFSFQFNHVRKEEMEAWR
jgi:hypothetical protein